MPKFWDVVAQGIEGQTACVVVPGSNLAAPKLELVAQSCNTTAACGQENSCTMAKHYELQLEILWRGLRILKESGRASAHTHCTCSPAHG
jgi:hypothetical protein